MGKGFKGLLFGGAIGAAIGILYAPRAGKKTRALLAEKTDALWGEDVKNPDSMLAGAVRATKSAVEAGQNFFNDATPGKFGDFTKDAKAKTVNFAQETEKKAQNFVPENVRPAFSEKNDELRKKIDSAREKIANQVARNLEDHQADSVSVTPSAVKNPPIPKPEPGPKKPEPEKDKKEDNEKKDK